MKAGILMLYLVAAAFSNPIVYKVVVKTERIESNGSLFNSKSSEESQTSDLQSSESESDSSESISEEKGWIRVFESFVEVLSTDDKSSIEVKRQPNQVASKETDKRLHHTTTTTAIAFGHTTATTQNTGSLSIEKSLSKGLDILGVQAIYSESNDSSESSDSSSLISSNADSSKSGDNTSSESSESDESSDSDSEEKRQRLSKDCLQGANSTACESEEYSFQEIGDDSHAPMHHLMVPDEDREFSLRKWKCFLFNQVL